MNVKIRFNSDATECGFHITGLDNPVFIDTSRFNIGERKAQMGKLVVWKMGGCKGWPPVVTPKRKK